ncbi:MAG: hypoxanthine phosphoribosyltransferase [Clostridia bacterium]|nr:hypoxanthine phosphoribosyltransferase [Clostridia bacterium]MBO5298552.1 hypoxanthine phosphoribosyltransferase [Clostridia bacterium]
MKDIKVFLSEEEIKAKVAELGKKISDDYRESDKNLILIAILKGSVVFLSDLMRNIDIDLNIDFMVVSSYGASTESSGNIKIIKDLDINIRDYDLLIVEDILDSGRTLSKLIDILKMRDPKSLKVCTLLDKPDRRVCNVDLDYCGFVIPDEFIVGYGLDFDEKYRNLPYIGILEP